MTRPVTEQQTHHSEPMFSETAVPRPRKSRRALALAVVATLILVLVVVATIVDGAARGMAEDRVEVEVANRLPDGAGDVTASIGGFSFLWQFFSGSLKELDVSVLVDGEALPALAGVDGVPPLQIADGVLTYEGTVEAFGLELGYLVTLEPTIDAGYLVFTPTGAEATTELGGLDLDQLIDLDALAFRVCTASLLPDGMELTKVNVVDSTVRLDLSGRDIPIDIEALRTRGSCD